MPNPDFSEIKKGMGGRAKSPPSPGTGKGKMAGMNEKPAFPGMGAPGKTQGKDRSGGVKKARVYPYSDGL